MAPVSDGGRVRICGGGVSRGFLGTACGGGGGTPLAHYDWVRAAELVKRRLGYVAMAAGYSEEEDGGAAMGIKALRFFPFILAL
jgi:hypothetical protein